jgi:hypothetical protein
VSREEQLGMAQPRRSYVGEDFPTDRRGDVHVMQILGIGEMLRVLRA